MDAEVAFYGLLDDVGAAAAELAGRLMEGDISTLYACDPDEIEEIAAGCVPLYIVVNDISQQVPGCTSCRKSRLRILA